jgi:type II secretion system protein G
MKKIKKDKRSKTLLPIAYCLLPRLGFTLIELLVVIAIIGILSAISLFALQNARQNSRDAKRKADLEAVRSALELYKSDCDIYPQTLPTSPNPLRGSGSPASCATTNTYISGMPADPVSTHRYPYSRPTTTTYVLCAALEQAPSPAMDVSACGSCGSCGAACACNYIVVSP